MAAGPLGSFTLRHFARPLAAPRHMATLAGICRPPAWLTPLPMLPPWSPPAAEVAVFTPPITMTAPLVGKLAELLGRWADFLRPRKFSRRLDVRMKRGAAPYPRNPMRKKPIPRVKGILRKILD
eukprot:NODE_25450_length_587_cov_1.586957.p3 GENE.NODE_25450_length_587_cov_1.586957~~NODE_25450_length_587_cov_1.586957.p3  ORF type:complete len:124 (-),score=24.40 NODE_25450_length_587_cov_1.586957:144-515(-)